MFAPDTYQKRRVQLRKALHNGVVLFLGNTDVPFNYPANTYAFRQDSSFLYFFGLAQPDLAAIIDIDSGEEYLFGDDSSIDDIIWMGQQPAMAERAASVAITKTLPYAGLAEFVEKIVRQKRPVHFLPPYRAETKIQLFDLLHVHPNEQVAKASKELIRAVVSLRSVKEAQEIVQIEQAVDITGEMHQYVMQHACAGMIEQELAGAIEGIALSHSGGLSFQMTLSINGQILHNYSRGHILQEGQLLLVDAGAENAMGYAGDITRTIPVGEQFSPQQKDIYQIVLDANLKAIDICKPGVLYRDVHIAVSRVLADGLKQIGLMKGDVDEAVLQGAHALFFPHGLGHMMGLDVHDMEGLGESYVGYDQTISRSTQFGLSALRMARKLEPGFVITDEPGLYFIPALIDQWGAEKKCAEFINYEKLKSYRDFGGIRIEDDLLITETGCRVLGNPIPKTVEDLEKIKMKD